MINVGVSSNKRLEGNAHGTNAFAAARKELLLRQGDEIRERIAGLERALARLE